jgi:hypothetical protein
MIASYDFLEVSLIEHVCCLAGLIYIEVFLFRTNTNAIILQTLHGRLQVSIAGLEEALQHEFDDNRSRVVLWALMIGSVSLTSYPYSERLRSVSGALRLSDWFEVGDILRGFVFPGDFLPDAECAWSLAMCQGMSTAR